MRECGGLRERKNERTRIAIERAALELALEQGFEHTTVNEIAARADVAPRTIFGRYATKDAIVFRDEAVGSNRLQTWLDGPADTLVDRLAEFIGARVAQSNDDPELERLRMRAMLTDPYLRSGLRGKLDGVETRIATRLAEEFDLPPDDAGPHVFAAAVSGLFLTMAKLAIDDPVGFNPLQECKRGLDFLSAGLATLQQGDSGRRAAHAQQA